MFISNYENNRSENLALYLYTICVCVCVCVCEPRSKVRSCFYISEISMDILLVNFQRPDNIFENNFIIRNK